MTGDTTPQRTLTLYVSAGLSPTVALDLYMTKDVGMTPEAWASIRGMTGRAIVRNLKKAGETFPGLDVEEVTA